ncbi:MAG: hypothetical protein GY722_07630 [bacterium]|nr:hypothetical protein [bacterium]
MTSTFAVCPSILTEVAGTADRTDDKSVAIQIGGELAAAVERRAAVPV